MGNVLGSIALGAASELGKQAVDYTLGDLSGTGGYGVNNNNSQQPNYPSSDLSVSPLEDVPLTQKKS